MVSPQESRPNNRIFVGKLSLDVDQNALKEHFSQVGEIVNIKVKKNSRRNIAFAFINFANENSPQEALSKFHDKEFNGSQIDVQIAKEVTKTPKRNNNAKNNNPRNNNNNRNNGNNNNGNDEGKNAGNRQRRQKRASNNNNNNNRNNNNNENKEKELSLTTLFVSNLPFVVDDDKLKQLFDGFNVKTAYTVTRNGRSRGYGFVEFETEEAAKSALEAKNKLQVEDREISVRNAFKNDEPSVQKSTSSDTLYVSNLPYKLTDETLLDIFKDYNVAKAYVARTKKGRSKGFGFVVLAGDDLAAKQEKAIAEKNKHKIEDREIFVRAAYNSAEAHDNGENGNNNDDSNEPDVKQIALYVSNIPFAVTSVSHVLGVSNLNFFPTKSGSKTLEFSANLFIYFF